MINHQGYPGDPNTGFGAARPGVEATTTSPGEQETRENNVSTNQERSASALRKKRRWAIGAVAAILATGLAGGLSVAHEINSQRKANAVAPTPGSEGVAGGNEVPAERPPLPTGERVDKRDIFTAELTLDEVLEQGLPNKNEYATDKSADKAIAALGKKLQYAINVGGKEGEELISESFNTGYQATTLKPTQLLARMDYVEQNRADPEKSKRGLLDDYYAYGLELEVVNDRDIARRSEPGSETRLVKLRMGDYQPHEQDGIKFERQHEQLVAIKVARALNVIQSADGTVHEQPTKSGGWEIVDIRPVIVDENGKHRPVYNNDLTTSGIQELPPAYYDSLFTPLKRRDLEPIY